MIKIGHLFRAPNGTQEDFSLEYSTESFADLPLEGKIKASGHLMRVEEGIMLLLENLEAAQVAPCSRCGKTLRLPLNFQESEWLYYETEPDLSDDENELLRLDLNKLELDPTEAIRQDLILNLEATPRCKKLCKSFEEGGKREAQKPLAALKDLLS